jgi:hypothetical protein
MERARWGACFINAINDLRTGGECGGGACLDVGVVAAAGVVSAKGGRVYNWCVPPRLARHLPKSVTVRAEG